MEERWWEKDRFVHPPEVVEAAQAWLDGALRSGFTHINEMGLQWLWADDAPEVESWPSHLEVANYFDALAIPIAGGSGITYYEDSDRPPSMTKAITILWEDLGKLIQMSPFLRQALQETLAGN